MARRSTEERRVEIAEAAVRIIARDGLARFTTAAIAAEVGIAEGTIFRHFPTKEAIVDAVVSQVEESVGPLPEEGSPLERLRAFFLHRTALIQENPAIFQLFYSNQLTFAGSPEAGARINTLKEASLRFLRECVQEGIRQGELRKGAALAPLVSIIQGAAMSLAFSVLSGDTPLLSPATVWNTLEALIAAPKRS